MIVKIIVKCTLPYVNEMDLNALKIRGFPLQSAWQPPKWYSMGPFALFLILLSLSLSPFKNRTSVFTAPNQKSTEMFVVDLSGPKMALLIVWRKRTNYEQLQQSNVKRYCRIGVQQQCPNLKFCKKEVKAVSSVDKSINIWGTTKISEFWTDIMDFFLKNNNK